MRRPALETFHRRILAADDHVRLSRSTGDLEVARSWLINFAGNWMESSQSAWISRIYPASAPCRRSRTCGRRIASWAASATGRVQTVGSLLLGLYNKGLLDHVGFTSSIAASSRAALTRKLEKLIQPPGFTGGAPGGPSRWSTDRSTEWEPLKPVLVAEVQFDHFTGGRFRHGTKFLRWRPDKIPSSAR